MQPIHYLLLTSLLLFHLPLFAQTSCNCEGDLDFLIEKIENEHPGFKVNVTKDNRARYESFKDSIRREVQSAEITKDACLQQLKKYLTFIKDKHLRVYDPARVREDKEGQDYIDKRRPAFRELSAGTAYVKVPSFNYRLWRELDTFYDSIAPLLQPMRTIVLDIRNNGGGGERMYKQLVKLLKKESKQKKIGVIFNRGCGSACEEVALMMRNDKRILTFGENTNGQFAYSFIKGHETPYCQFTFIITTKRYPERLPYEYVGVPPEVVLDKEKEADWLARVLERLKE